MLDHLCLQVENVEASLSFYLQVFAPLGMREAIRVPPPNGLAVGLAGSDGRPVFWLTEYHPGTTPCTCVTPTATTWRPCTTAGEPIRAGP